MRALGVEAARIRVTGNLKFDRPPRQIPDQEREELIQQLGWKASQSVWIAGSTHPGEEEAILKVYSLLRQRFSELSLILAPRNPERFSEVARMVERSGWQTIRRSQLGEGAAGPVDVLVLDTIGELEHFYSLGDFAFLGGSLIPFGGHNPLEPVRWGLPVVFGPHMENFRDIAAILLKSGGGFQAAGQTELHQRVRAWLMEPLKCREHGEKGRWALLDHQGAVARNMEVIRELLRIRNSDCGIRN
jgi:3-deoxy-D-manno-octulosonic-acid transferase